MNDVQAYHPHGRIVYLAIRDPEMYGWFPLSPSTQSTAPLGENIARQTYVDKGGDYAGWFDMALATQFDDGVTWDQNANPIHASTGSQWWWGCLYLTERGEWVLQSLSAIDRRDERGEIVEGDTWTLLSDAQALAWLASTGIHGDAIEEHFGVK